MPALRNLDAANFKISALKSIDFTDFSELTIASGAITVTQTCHTVDTESDVASDNLDTIGGGSNGMLLFIRPESDSRTVVVKHNTGNIWLSGNTDITLDDIRDCLELIYDGTKWVDLIGGVTASAHARSHDVESSSDHPASSKKGLFLKTNASTGAIEIVAHGLSYGDVGAEVSGAAATHAALTTGVHGVGLGTVAKVGDIAVDGNLSSAAQAAITASHAAITLGTDADVLLGLSTQQIVLDSQNVNVVFAGPATGAAADPTFRSLVAADIPDISATYSAKAGNTSLITVGTITTGHWHGDAVDAEHGGTGLTVGVSGGVPFFSSTTAMTSSALLTQYGVMIGGGAGVAPSTIAASTTTTQALFATAGAPAFRAIAAGDLPGTLNATTFGGDVSLGANKLKTTNLLLKEASATYMGIRTAADDAWRYLQCLGVYFESDYPITINKNGASYLQPASATYTNYVLNLQGATGAALATVARVVSGATPYFDIPASGDVVPAVDNTYYCGDYLKGYKGIIVKDTVLAAYYAIQVVSGVVTAVAVTS